MSDRHGSEFRTIAVPFIIFTAIWGSTWIVIRGQLGVVPAQWSVTYRFIIAAAAMAIVAAAKGKDLRLGKGGAIAALFLGLMQFCVNFNAVYLAERHITSGVVATVFALLLIPSSLLAWAFLGQRPSARFAWSSAIAVAARSEVAKIAEASSVASVAAARPSAPVTIVAVARAKGRAPHSLPPPRSPASPATAASPALSAAATSRAARCDLADRLAGTLVDRLALTEGIQRP